ncbi:MAG: flavodoxin family protein [Proteobacteria bacterium]|nr:flavodoxin family protein [Pseudomonadota bacterium]MBU1638976.1 flavodoxin family protein [Pseudomonadota bacterium]
MKVLAINGSPRPTGNTSILIRAVLDELEKEGIKTETIQLGGQPVRGCVACMKCLKEKNKRCANNDDNMNEYIEKMIAADGILLGSPTYFADVSSEIKALIDRAGYVSRVNGSLFKRKVGAAVVAMRRAGSVHAFDTMNHLFTISEMIIPSSSYWNMGVGLKPGDVKDDKEGMETMRILGENMAWLLKKLHP